MTNNNEDKGKLVYDSDLHGCRRRAYVKDYDPAGKWGYSVWDKGDGEELCIYETAAYDSEASATMAALFRAGPDVPIDDPRLNTVSVQMCRELWDEIKSLNADINMLRDELSSLHDKYDESKQG